MSGRNEQLGQVKITAHFGASPEQPDTAHRDQRLAHSSGFQKCLVESTRQIAALLQLFLNGASLFGEGAEDLFCLARLIDDHQASGGQVFEDGGRAADQIRSEHRHIIEGCTRLEPVQPVLPGGQRLGIESRRVDLEQTLQRLEPGLGIQRRNGLHDELGGHGQGPLRGGVEHPQRLDLVSKELDSHRFVRAGREDIQHATPPSKRSRILDQVNSLVSLLQPIGQCGLEVDLCANPRLPGVLVDHCLDWLQQGPCGRHDDPGAPGGKVTRHPLAGRHCLAIKPHLLVGKPLQSRKERDGPFGPGRQVASKIRGRVRMCRRDQRRTAKVLEERSDGDGSGGAEQAENASLAAGRAETLDIRLPRDETCNTDEMHAK